MQRATVRVKKHDLWCELRRMIGNLTPRVISRSEALGKEGILACRLLMRQLEERCSLIEVAVGGRRHDSSRRGSQSARVVVSDEGVKRVHLAHVATLAVTRQSLAGATKSLEDHRQVVEHHVDRWIVAIVAERESLAGPRVGVVVLTELVVHQGNVVAHLDALGMVLWPVLKGASLRVLKVRQQQTRHERGTDTVTHQALSSFVQVSKLCQRYTDIVRRSGNLHRIVLWALLGNFE